MPGQIPPHIWGTSIRDLDSVSVDKLTQGGSLGEVLVYKAKELLPNLSLYVHAERRIKPNYIPASFSLSLIACVF